MVCCKEVLMGDDGGTCITNKSTELQNLDVEKPRFIIHNCYHLWGNKIQPQAV